MAVNRILGKMPQALWMFVICWLRSLRCFHGQCKCLGRIFVAVINGHFAQAGRAIAYPESCGFAFDSALAFLHHRRLCHGSALFHVCVGIGRFLHDCMHRGVERIGFLLAASPPADVLSTTLPMRDRSGKSAPVDHPSTYTRVDFPRYRTEDIE